MTKRALIFPLASVMVLAVGFIVGSRLISQPQRLENKAATPSGTAIFKLLPGSATIWTPTVQALTGVLNTNLPISGYQAFATFSYTTTTPPASLPTTVTSNEPALNCLTNRITLDTTAKKYTLVVSCAVPVTFPATTYTTNGIDRTMFTLNLSASSAGALTYTFDNANSYVTSSVDASDILANPAGGSYTIQTDTTAPAAITTLQVGNPTLNSLRLTWTAPSDSGPAGKASSYDVRYSTSAITAANFNSATAAASPPIPAAAGAAESFTVSGLNAATTYFFAIKSTDAANNTSTISNVVSAGTINQGSLIFNLKFQGVTASLTGRSVNLTLQQGTVVKYTFNTVALTATNGVYAATIPNIDAGTYDVYLKGPASLRKKVAGVVIAFSTNTTNWPATPPTLLAGDITQDNKVDLLDYSQLVLKFDPGTTQLAQVEDLNFDSKVDLLDYSLLVLNFNPGVTGD